MLKQDNAASIFKIFGCLILVSMQNAILEVVHQSKSPTMTHDFLYKESEVTVRSLSHEPKPIFLVDILQHLSLDESTSALLFSFS